MAPGQGTRSDGAGGAGAGGEGPSTRESCAPCRAHLDLLFSFILRSATSCKFEILVLNII